MQQTEQKTSFAKLEQIAPGLRSGRFGNKVELVYLSEKCSVELRRVSELLRLIPRVFPYKPVLTSNLSLIGVAAIFNDNYWLTELGHRFPSNELNDLIIETRVQGLKEIRSRPLEGLFRGQSSDGSILLAIEEKIPTSELVGIIELLHSCGSKKVIPLTNPSTTESVLSCAFRFDQILEM